MGANRHAGDEYDVSNDIYPERHQAPPKKKDAPTVPASVRSLCAQAHVCRGIQCFRVRGAMYAGAQRRLERT
jgi:hypothetical protein